MSHLTDSPLGKKIAFTFEYDPSLLFSLPREHEENPPFTGADIWNSYELSWLTQNGKPEVRIAEFIVPCESPRLLESKSLKLYLNSFTQTKFASEEVVKETIRQDLSQAVGGSVHVNFLHANQVIPIGQLEGICLDDLDITTDVYHPDPSLLTIHKTKVQETLHSHLLKSNCLITGQPDWASILVRYQGKQIDHPGLLRYIISSRNHLEMHEHCVERMFRDILKMCQPEKLTIYARYTRRGGLDINPFRSNFEELPDNIRLARQ